MVLDPVGFVRCILEQHPNGTLMSKEHDFRRPPQAFSCRVNSMRSRRAFSFWDKIGEARHAALPPRSCRPLQDADAALAFGNLNLFGPYPKSLPPRTLWTLSTSSCIYDHRIQLALCPLLAWGAWEARDERLWASLSADGWQSSTYVLYILYSVLTI